MASRKTKEALFDDSEDESEGGAELKINDEYAQRFEYNKKREERHRLEEKYKAKGKNPNAAEDDEDDDSSDDETEDEDGLFDTPELHAQWNQTLQAIRNKDPRIYDAEATFYAEKEEPAEEAGPSKAKKDKPIYLKDYHREKLLAGDTGADDQQGSVPKTYAEEQGDLQQSIRDEIKAQLERDAEVASDDDGGDFIKAKKGAVAKAQAELAEGGIHPSRAGKVKVANISVEDADKDPELFLSNFLSSRSWAQDDNKWEAFESDEGEDDGGQADEWEAAYNLRFEDPSKSNEVLRSYARDVAAAKSVRREEKTGRAKRRDIEKEQKEAEKQQRREERARLRKLKVEEAENRLKQIKKTAGLSGKTLQEDDWIKFLNDEWENGQWEEAMAKAFGEEYYAEEDAVSGGEEGEAKKSKKVKKPKWDDDIDIKDLVPDFEDEELPSVALDPEDGGDDNNEGDDGEEDEDNDAEDGRSAKRQKTTKERKKERLVSQKAARQERSKIEALVDAKMDMDEPEALAGGSSKGKGMPRFAYRETWAESYGLTARDILMAPTDAALNEFVGLKKLAHFRPDDKKAKDKKRLGKKARLRQWRRETFGPEAEKEGPAFSFGGPREPAADADNDEAANVIEGGSSKKKRKRSGRKGKGVA